MHLIKPEFWQFAYLERCVPGIYMQCNTIVRGISMQFNKLPTIINKDFKLVRFARNTNYLFDNILWCLAQRRVVVWRLLRLRFLNNICGLVTWLSGYGEARRSVDSQTSSDYTHRSSALLLWRLFWMIKL